MGSQGGGAIQENKSQSVSRQGSLYSLTLHEVQNQLGGSGKPLGSMNLDELLKSVLSAEASTQGPNIGVDHIGVAAEPGQHSLLPRQPSFTLSGDLSKKTVDELWKDIQLGKNNSNLHVSENSDRHEGGNQERNPTFGEMTLEDFLVKAGIVTDSFQVDPNAGTVVGMDSVAAPPQNAEPLVQWMPYQLPSVQQQPQNVMTVFMPSHHTVQQPMAIGGGPMLDPAYPDMHVTASPSSLIGTLSDTQTPGRKRVAPRDAVERTVERRQKRMIKNRESAARSRARKQAYTNELEIKVSRLEEENARLRRQREAERALPCAPPPEQKNQLRRTSSAPF